jgi:hypothetical protein
MTHGGTTPKPQDRFDPALVVELSRRLAKRLDRYWVELGASGSERSKLAEAKVRPLWTAGAVVFVGDMKNHVSNGGTPGSGLLY